MLNRRHFLSGAAGAAAAQAIPTLAAKGPRIDRARISAITDEIAVTPAAAMEFAHQYGLKWVELRRVPGQRKNYWDLDEGELKAAAKEFRDAGLGVSFLNTGLLKFTLPGTEYIRQKAETPEVREKRLAREQQLFDRRIEDLRRGIRTAQALNVDILRVFAFMRVAEPAKIEQRIVETIGEMAVIAGKEGVRLLIENEAACNVATCAELTSMVNKLPAKSVGLNWDPLNGVHQKEPAFPDGYRVLPKARIGNVQIKGKSLLDEKERLDWAAIFHALEKDGYRGKVGLETHYFDGTLIEKSHLSVKEIFRICDTLDKHAQTTEPGARSKGRVTLSGGAPRRPWLGFEA